MAVDASVVGARAGSVLRHSAWDAALVSLSIVHGLALLFVPSVPVVAIGLWWNANTIAHTFIHTPFFRARELNLAFSVYLSAVLGIPQTLWRERHLQHHSGRPHRLRASPLLLLETGVVVSLWLAMALAAPRFFFSVYVPGYAVGLGLCFLQGYFEHARGTTSHYGRLYNLCFFNDGYHVEHHRRPGEHWTRLPGHAVAGAQHSAWPPVLRWLDVFSLESLERIVLRSRVLQRLVLAVHERAMRTLIRDLHPIARVTIVGGGLFPRTALILRRLLPNAELTIVDDQREHLDIARTFLGDAVAFRHGLFDPRSPDDADLLVIPLAFIGDRRAFYRRSPARWTLVHDWIWNRQATGVPVSLWLLKRLNLVAR